MAAVWAEKEIKRWSDLYSSVTAEVKIELVGMRDVRIHGSTSRNVSTTSNLQNQSQTMLDPADALWMLYFLLVLQLKTKRQEQKMEAGRAQQKTKLLRH